MCRLPAADCIGSSWQLVLGQRGSAIRPEFSAFFAELSASWLQANILFHCESSGVSDLRGGKGAGSCSNSLRSSILILPLLIPQLFSTSGSFASVVVNMKRHHCCTPREWYINLLGIPYRC